MKKIFTAVAASALLMLGSVAANAQGASDQAPGQKMQDKGSKPGTTGASGYAPGQNKATSGSGTKSSDEKKR